MEKFENKKEINYTLNVMKFLAIFAIIIIHCAYWRLGKKGAVIQAISRFAVPIFFMVSGYFSYFEYRDKAMKKYKVRLNRLIKLLISASILYIIFYFFVLHKPIHYTVGNALNLIIFKCVIYIYIDDEY